MVFIGASVFGAVSAVSSSSARPFLKDLMPLATSPIKSETLPRPPKTSRSTAPTINQCQMLKEPMKSSVRLHAHNAAHPRQHADFSQKLGVGTGKNKRNGHAAKPQGPVRRY